MESTQQDTRIARVSVHGGHSGQFCHHAKDSLDEVIRAYIDQGFTWVGITEHMPPPVPDYRYPDEVQAGLEARELQRRFGRYFEAIRTLRERYQDRIELLAAFETEWYPGAADYVRELIERYQPDYIVGSLHHVRGIGIDFSKEHYELAVAECGSMEQLYCDYFDEQYELLRELVPAVVGHFDLIRIFDPGYQERLLEPAIAQRIRRNLEMMRDRDMILDFNLRGFHKGQEAYPSLPVLRQALEMGIAVVPGDDSHGVASVGSHYDRGIEVLKAAGAPLDWVKPRLL